MSDPRYEAGIRAAAAHLIAEEMDHAEVYAAKILELLAPPSPRGFDEYGNHGENNPPVGAQR